MPQLTAAQCQHLRELETTQENDIQSYGAKSGGYKDKLQFLNSKKQELERQLKLAESEKPNSALIGTLAARSKMPVKGAVALALERARIQLKIERITRQLRDIGRQINDTEKHLADAERELRNLRGNISTTRRELEQCAREGKQFRYSSIA